MLARFFQTMCQEITGLYAVLPSEIKVILYIVFSALLAEIYNALATIKVDSLILSGIINVALVTVREYQKRRTATAN